MRDEKIEMVKVPEYNRSTTKQTSDEAQEVLNGEKNKNQRKNDGTSRGDENMRNPKCEAHGEEMEQIGESERGIPEWYCPQGCKLEMGKGRVKTVIEDKGFGFIAVDSGSEVFCHVSELRSSWPPEEGDLCRFKMGLNPVKGELQAVDIRNLSADGRN